jgi:hypothetical protein
MTAALTIMTQCTAERYTGMNANGAPISLNQPQPQPPKQSSR